MLGSLKRLWNRGDFRQNPGRAIWRRMYWRLRWLHNSNPWPLRLTKDLVVLAPRTGSGALIYYQGQSEPETAQFIRNFLKPGMVFFDVGAHIGEYTVQASRIVGETGQVHAFEPEKELFNLMEATLRRNNIRNTFLSRCAIADQTGFIRFAVAQDLPCSSILVASNQPSLAVRRTETVPVRTLDSYCDDHSVRPDLIKVDVEGAEVLVLRGAEKLLSLPSDIAPVWIIEYSAINYSRFGFDGSDLFAQLNSHGYQLFDIEAGCRRTSPGDLRNDRRPHNLVASTRSIQ